MPFNSNLFINPQIFGAYQRDPRLGYAQALMQEGASTAPVRSPLEGVARALQGGLGGYFAGQTRRDYEQQGEKYRKGLAAALNNQDVLGALVSSDDPYLQQQGMEAKLQRQLNPEKDPLVQVFDPTTKSMIYKPQSQAIGLQAKAPDPLKAPETREIMRGNQRVYQQFNPQTGHFEDVGSGPAFAPQQPPAPPEVIRLLQASGIDPKSPQGQAAIAHALGTEQKPQFGGIITGQQAQAMGLDPKGSYQQGPDGKWNAVVSPQQGGGTFGKLITGPEAKAMGLDPNGTYQQASNGKWEVISSANKSTSFGPVITGEAARAQGLDPNGTWQQSSTGEWKTVGTQKDDPAAVATLKAMGIDPKSDQGKAMLQQNLAGAGNSPFKQENTLRDEYNQLTKTYGEALAGYNKVAAAANNPSAAGDIALIFGYMKTLDPNSTVREGEFATAAQSGSVPERILNVYNKVLSGERLTADQRLDFATSAQNQFQVYQQRKEELDRFYSGLATRSGGSPQNVIVPFQNPAAPPTPDMGGLDVWQEYGLTPPPNYKRGGGQ